MPWTHWGPQGGPQTPAWKCFNIESSLATRLIVTTTLPALSQQPWELAVAKHNHRATIMGCHFTKTKVIPTRPVSELNLSKEELDRVKRSIQEPGKTSAQIIKELMDVGIVDPRFASGGIAFNVGNMDPACQRQRRLEKLDLPESTLLKEEKLRMKLHKAQCRRMFKDAERAAKIEERKKLRASALIKKEENMKAKAEVND